jgi:hypothetical protein
MRDVPPLPNTPSGRGAQLKKHVTALHFTFNFKGKIVPVPRHEDISIA